MSDAAPKRGHGDGRARVALLMTSFGSGGVERMMLNLARGFAAQGRPVDLVVARAEHPFLTRLGPGVRLIEAGPRRRSARRWLARYFDSETPAAVLSSKRVDDGLMLAAREDSLYRPRLFTRVGAHLSTSGELQGRNPLRRWINRCAVIRRYGRADGVICVSDGVAEDLAAITGLPRARIRVIRNPTITPELRDMAAQPPDHPWFERFERPIVLAVGRLAMMKGHDVLLRAFARLRARRPARLVILGEGRERRALERLARALGIGDDVSFPGLVQNPYPLMARSSVLALSSILREGSPNVLVEAMALGTPVVASDCPSGPREILDGGRCGPLVPVGDDRALATAIDHVLANPTQPRLLREAVREYTLETSSRAYSRAMGLDDADA